MGGSVKNVLLVLGVNAVSAAVPFTPQGAGVAQALLVSVFAGTAKKSTVAAYSVGQQVAIGVLTFGIGFAALVFIFHVRSFKEVVALDRRTAPRRPRAAPRPTRPRPLSRLGICPLKIPSAACSATRTSCAGAWRSSPSRCRARSVSPGRTTRSSSRST